MAAGSSSQQSFRKAIGAIKDSTSVGLAKVNSEYKDLNVSILKATNHVEVLPKEKHVRIILGAVSDSRPRADVSFCIHALLRRLAKTHTWVVALKTLIVLHRMLREVDLSFCKELILHYKGRGHLLNLLHFKDDASPNAWDYSAWIRTYSAYIEECLECFRVLDYDFHRDHSRTKKLDTPDLFKHLPAMQNLLFRLLGCEPLGAARRNFMIQYALSIVAAESVRLYVVITDGVLVLIDKVRAVFNYFSGKITITALEFFEMQRPDAIKAFEIYRKSGKQAQRLSEFFEMCRNLEFGRNQKYVKIEQPPESFLKVMEDYIKEAPQMLTLPWKNDNEVPKLITAVPDVDSESDSNQEGKTDSPDECTETNQNDKDTAPLIPDLLSWDEPSQEESVSDEVNTPEAMSEPTTSSEPSSQPSGWELALASTPPTSSHVELNKGGVLDRSLLDSLYDAQQTNTNGPYPITNAPSNPFESDAYGTNTLYQQSPNYMQQPESPQQQLVLFTQDQGLNHQAHQQEGVLVVSYEYYMQDFTQMSEVSRPREIPQRVGVESTSGGSRNPFDDPPPSGGPQE